MKTSNARKPLNPLSLERAIAEANAAARYKMPVHKHRRARLSRKAMSRLHANDGNVSSANAAVR